MPSREDLQVGTMTAIERGGGTAMLTTENSEAFVKMSLLSIIFHGK